MSLIILLLLGLAGSLLYWVTRPVPMLLFDRSSSPNQVDVAPNAVLHLEGEHFSSNSPITLLRDGEPLSVSLPVYSDDNGAFEITVAITDDWIIGQHLLTAQDAGGYKTRQAIKIIVGALPVLSVNSQYAEGNIAAGTQGTSVTILGKYFSPRAPVTLFDQDQAISFPPLVSDQTGQLKLSLLITATWTIGIHHLLAKDDHNYLTDTPALVQIVPQGQANTPGPSGAPADDESFSVQISVTHHDTVTQAELKPFQVVLEVSGHPDPAGGSVCDPINDNGQPHTLSLTTSNRVQETQVLVWECSGTYRMGHLSYAETVTSETITFSNGGKCTLNGPYTSVWDGTFLDAHHLTGSYQVDPANYSCSFGSATSDPEAGSWTGSVRA